MELADVMIPSLLSWTIFLPLAGVVVLAFMKNEHVQAAKMTGFVTSLATFAVSLALWSGYDAANPAFQFVEQVPWIASLNISYHVGIDGMALLLILLTTFLRMPRLNLQPRIHQER